MFLTEVDNVAYALGLGEQARARVEAVGRVELSESDAAFLSRTKIVHIVVIVAGIGGMVASCDIETVIYFTVAWWLAGLAESIRPSPAETAKRMAMVTISAIAGWAVGTLAFMYSLGT